MIKDAGAGIWFGLMLVVCAVFMFACTNDKLPDIYDKNFRAKLDAHTRRMNNRLLAVVIAGIVLFVLIVIVGGVV